MIAPAKSEHLLHESIRIPWIHRGKVLACFAAVVAAALLVTFFTPKTYRSEGKLLLRLGRENMALDPTAMLGATQVLTVQQTRENEINSVIEILHSRVLIEKVVDAVGPASILSGKLQPPETPSADDAANGQTADAEPAATLEQRADAVRRLDKQLNAEAVKKSNIVEITCDTGSPELAQAIVNQLIRSFQDEYVRLNRTPGAQEFLQEQTSSALQRLTDKENQLRKLKDETELESPENREAIMVTRIGHLEDEALRVSAELASEESQVKQLRDQLSSLPATQVNEQTVGFANEAADGMRQQLYALQIKEQELGTKLTDGHPQLREVRQQIEDAKKVLAQEQPERTQTKSGPSKPFEEVKLQLLKEEPVLAALKAKAGKLESQLADQEKALQKMNQDELRVAQLQREVQLEEAIYRKYSDNLEQARIDRAMAEAGKSNISIVQPATRDLKPIKPNTAMNLLLAIVVGGLGGLGLAFAAESLKGVHHAKTELENGHSSVMTDTVSRRVESLPRPIESIPRSIETIPR